MSRFKKHAVLKEKLDVLTSMMEEGTLTLEEWDMMLDEMRDTYKEICEIKKDIFN